MVRYGEAVTFYGRHAHGHTDAGPGDDASAGTRADHAGHGSALPGSVVTGVVVTVSDRCARGEAEDRSGPLAAELLGRAGVEAEVVVVPDGVDPVRRALRAALGKGARVVLTTGGTGISPRDLTPEATTTLLTRELPGLAEAIRTRGAVSVPTAVLSRGLAGVAPGRGGEALVVNVPGSTGAVRDALAVLAPLLPHILDQLAGGDHERALPV